MMNLKSRLDRIERSINVGRVVPVWIDRQEDAAALRAAVLADGRATAFDTVLLVSWEAPR